MAEENNNPQEQPENSSNDSRRKQRRIFYLILIVALVAINAFLLINNINKNNKAKQLASQNEELMAEKEALMAEVAGLDSILRAQMGENVILDSLIIVKQGELDSVKEELTTRLNKRDITISQLRKALDKAKKEVDDWQTKYEEDVAALQEQIATLEAEKSELIETLQIKKVEIDELNELVEKGSVLIVEKMQAYGLKIRNNEKEVTTKRARRTDKVRVCFFLAENKIAANGPQKFFLRLLSPEGTTLAVQSMGSGSFRDADTGSDKLYTQSGTIDYKTGSTDQEYCMEWRQEQGFQKGLYLVEVYHLGYLVGKSELTLK